MPSMAITSAQRLKRVFGIDIETCPAGGRALRISACMQDPEVIKSKTPVNPMGPPHRSLAEGVDYSGKRSVKWNGSSFA